MLDITGRCVPNEQWPGDRRPDRGHPMTRTSHVSDRRRFTTRNRKELSFTAMGFGSAPLGNYLRPLSEQDCDRTLSAAWDSGMRYFDTAPLYGLGLSEVRVGRLLAQHPREDFIVSTKVGRLLTPCAREIGRASCRER